nr:zinc-binding dehydrogenase [Sagittula marina]
MTEMWAEGTLRPVIDRGYPLNEVVDALRHVEGGPRRWPWCCDRNCARAVQNRMIENQEGPEEISGAMVHYVKLFS